MKKTIIHSILMLLVLSISYGGSGFSYMIYCCGACETFGTESVLDHKCCDTHNAHHLDETLHGMITFQHTEHESFCDMERTLFDWTSANVFLPLLQPAVIDLGFFHPHHPLLPSLTEDRTYTNYHYLATITASPRDYLSLLRVLII